MAWAANDRAHPLLSASIVEIGDPMLGEAITRVRASGKTETVDRDPAGPRQRASRCRVALPRMR